MPAGGRRGARAAGICERWNPERGPAPRSEPLHAEPSGRSRDRMRMVVRQIAVALVLQRISDPERLARARALRSRAGSTGINRSSCCSPASLRSARRAAPRSPTRSLAQRRDRSLAALILQTFRTVSGANQ